MTDQRLPPPRAATNFDDPKSEMFKTMIRKSTRTLLERLAFKLNTTYSDTIERALKALADKEELP